jgi:glycosyltransferase involved in cell wall biosynthesis
MKVTFVLEYYPPHLGGIQVVFKNLAERLADRGHDVTVVTARTPDTRRAEVRNGVSIRRSPVVGRLDRYTFTISGIPDAVVQCRQADIVHTSTWTGAVPGWLAKSITATPALMTVHEVFAPKWDETDMSLPSRLLHGKLEQALYSLSFDRYSVVSEYTKEQLVAQGKAAADIDVIYNGIDTDTFDPRRVEPDWMKTELGLEDQFVYTYFGRPGPFKGVEYLVRAVPRIRAEADDATLLLILSHEPQERYEALLETIDRLGIEDAVRVIDPVERSMLPQYVGGSDCVVVPSLSEGFGFTAAEACALDVPVVASNAASLPEVVSGAHRFVEPGNPNAIAEGVLDVRRGDHDVTPRRTFDWERAIDEYLETYESLL